MTGLATVTLQYWDPLSWPESTTRWIPAEAVAVHVAELLAGTSPLTSAVLTYLVDVDAGPQPTDPTS